MTVTLNAVPMHRGYGYPVEFGVKRQFVETQRNVVVRQLIVLGGITGGLTRTLPG